MFLRKKQAIHAHRRRAAPHNHPWQNENKPTERYSSSSTWSQPAPKNLWAAPNSNRSLGNGTFTADLGTSQLSQIAKSGPGPIAPPSGGQSTSATARLPPIGPPSRPQQGGGQVPPTNRDAVASAWVAQVQKGDAAFRAMLNTEAEERDRKLKLEGRTLTDMQPQITDTWRPTKLDADGRRVESATKESIHRGPGHTWAGHSEPKAASSRQTSASHGRSDYQQQAQPHGVRPEPPSGSILESGSAGPQASRGSRFFPSRDARHEPAAASDHHRPKSPSPPPPDMAGHPAFDGDVERPQVSLPRQKPIVRLPPSASASTSGSLPSARGPNFTWSRPQAFQAPETGSTGHHAAHSQGSDWEAKIKGLFDDRRPPKPYVVQPSPVGVAFPFGSFRNLASGRDGSIISKVMAEECFEEQEMGSLPPVRLPNKVPEMAWQPSPAPKNFPRRFLPGDCQCIGEARARTSAHPLADGASRA